MVARELLGKFLVRKIDGRKISLIITETEAYDGPQDLASHARDNRRTVRTEAMFAPGGVWYVYFIYGVHYLLNIVTGKKDYPAAVLIRAARSNTIGGRAESINGPAKLTRFFRVDKKFNGLPATEETGLYIVGATNVGSQTPNTLKVISTPRIGVTYAGPVWSQKKYRYLISNG